MEILNFRPCKRVKVTGIAPQYMNVFTVNSDIFAKVLFSQNSAYAKFCEIKSSQKGVITRSFTDMSKTCPNLIFLHRKYVFNAICENKILAKISEFTVYC